MYIVYPLSITLYVFYDQATDLASTQVTKDNSSRAEVLLHNFFCILSFGGKIFIFFTKKSPLCCSSLKDFSHLHFFGFCNLN